MKRMILSFAATAILVFSGNAQTDVSEKPMFRRHIISFNAGYMIESGYGGQSMLAGAGYAYRFSRVYSLSVTAVAGPSFLKGFGTDPHARLFLENKFNIRGENTVQPAFTAGLHMGTGNVLNYASNSGTSVIRGFVMGANFGAGIEVLFARKRWMAGLHTRMLLTFGGVGIIDIGLHLQPTIAYRI